MFNFPKDLYADVRVEDIYESKIRLVVGELKQCNVRTYTAAFVRVFDGKRWFYEALTDVDQIQDTLDDLAGYATPSSAIKNHPVVVALEVNTGELMSFGKTSLADLPLEKKRKLIEGYAKLMDNDELITSWSANYEDRREVKTFWSSKGANIKFDTQRCGVMMNGDFASGEKKHQDGYNTGGTTFDEISSLEGEFKKWLERAKDFLLRAKPVKAGSYPVILSPDAAGVFAHECFGHKSEADFMVGDASAKEEWALGKKVGASILSIVDDGNEMGSGYTPFDDEGTKAQSTYLIKDGHLAGRLHNGTTAAALEETVTGNARSISFEYEPIPRMTTTYIGSGKMTKEELFAQVKDGIFIESLRHGSGMSTFTIAPSRAYRVVDGKEAEPVMVSVVTGQVFEALNDVQAVSDEIELRSFVGGGCGKFEQHPLPVGFGGPYVLVAKLEVR